MTGERGFSLVEAIVGMVILTVSTAILGAMLVQSARINRLQRTQAELQESARTCLSIVVQTLRTSGWNPRQVTGIAPVVPTPAGSTAVEQVRLSADLDGDGTLNGPDEIIDIRHTGDRVEWQRPLVSGSTFEILAVDISNDANGDGVVEPMFTLSSATAPKTVNVRITAQSKGRDVQSGKFLRYTLNSLVTLRNAP